MNGFPAIPAAAIADTIQEAAAEGEGAEVAEDAAAAAEAEDTGQQVEPHIPRNLLLQWHITASCNLRCSHCYEQPQGGLETGFAALLAILEQFEELLAAKSQLARSRIPAHVTVTGGEPLLHPHFFSLLEALYRHRALFSFAVLTNGSLIDRSAAKQLSRFQPAFVQVSLEGLEATHDAIRGTGSFQQTVAAIRLLQRRRIRTFISFTAHGENYRQFPAAAELGRSLGVARVWADRYIPLGSSGQDGVCPLTPAQTKEFVQLMSSMQFSRPRWFFKRPTEIAMHRALQFLGRAGEGKPYRCTAGDSLLTVLANADLCPCRRMPIIIGNLLQTRLHALYDQHPLLAQLRDRSKVPAQCARCAHAAGCAGGLRCLAYAVSGDPFAGDPGCWLRNEPLTNQKAAT